MNYETVMKLDAIDRRTVLRLSGVAAVGGLAGCSGQQDSTSTETATATDTETATAIDTETDTPEPTESDALLGPRRRAVREHAGHRLGGTGRDRHVDYRRRQPHDYRQSPAASTLPTPY